MTQIVEKIKKYIPYKLGWVNLIVSCTIMGFSIRFGFKSCFSDYHRSWFFVATMIYSLFTANLLLIFVNLLTQRFRVIQAAANCLMIFITFVFFAYHFKTKNVVDFSVMADNTDIAFSKESFNIIFTSLYDKFLYIGIAVVCTAIVLEIFFKILSSNKQQKPFVVKVIVAISVYMLVLFIPVKTYDEFAAFFKNIIRSKIFEREYLIKEINGFPFLRDGIESDNIFTANKSNQPNIIMVMVESYNANFNNRKIENREITPVFNSLTRKGLYVKNFYGNSIQTSKGQEATFMSVIPAMNGKIFRENPDLHVMGFPAILSKNNYETIFIQGNEDLAFDNTEFYMHKLGFNTVDTAMKHLKPGDEKSVWSWGPEDYILYRTLFDILDEKAKLKKPFFATVATISNHMRFDLVPVEKRKFYKNPQNYTECYSNSINLSDSQLAVLLNGIKERPYLKNTIIIITGDHSFPIDEHGNHFNENGAYEENFKIPFVLIWDGKIQPKIIEDRAYSQMDIAPTILDLIGLTNVANSFQGISIFKKSEDRHYIYLVQPYSGKYLSVVDYPIKFVKNMAAQKEYIYDLKKDPGESQNLIGKYPDSDVENYRHLIRNIYFSQKVLTKNQLWPN